jgi:hypothetical protein
MSMSSRSRFNKVALAVLLSVSCGGSGDKPSDSTPPVTQPPVAAATAAPSVTPTPLPGMQCNVSGVSKPSDNCNRESEGQFVAQVDAAIARVRSENPDLFDGAIIRDRALFRVLMYNALSRYSGLCVQYDEDRDGHAEIMLKNTNNFSEQYMVELSSGAVRGGSGAYRATCYPANFPVNPAPLPQRGDCSLPSSRNYGCDRVTPTLLHIVERTADEIVAARPDLVRGDAVLGNPNDYYNEMVNRLRGKGFCAIFDGEEINLKNSNDLSEHYHVITSWGALRRGTGAYRTTCRPAAF